MRTYRNFSHTSNYFFGTTLFGEETLYSIQTCNIPGLSFNHIVTSHRSIKVNLTADTLEFGDLSVSIILDEDLEIWKDIVNTMFTIREQDEGIGVVVEKESWLEIHNDDSKTILKLWFHRCMLSSISDLDFNTTSEDEILVLNVVIKYDHYTIEAI